MSRDLARERRFLARAGEPAFADHAAARLEAGERAYGDQWARRPLVELLEEIAEEAVDVACWAVLALQRLDVEDVGDAERARVAAALELAAREGGRAHHTADRHAAAAAARDRRRLHMRLSGVRRGDVVELRGDPVSLWLVIEVEPRRVTVQLRGRDVTRRTVGARDIAAHWQRRAGP